MRTEMGDLRLGIRAQVVQAALARAGFKGITTEPIHDRYLIEAPDGRVVQLPLFLVRGVCAAGTSLRISSNETSNKENT